jgi:hypothetical protein
MADYRRKTLRSFYCEEDLWRAFEELATAEDATIDRVINHALREALSTGVEPNVTQSTGPPLNKAVGVSVANSDDRPTSQRAPASASAPAPPPPPSVSSPPPAPQPGATPAPAAVMPSLFLHYGGTGYPVQLERFVIGRGSKGTDLMIRDGNVSRKHAVVIFHEGQFFIQDLGSTNGVEFDGQRIETKVIDEGDVYTICDHELTFSYRG